MTLETILIQTRVAKELAQWVRAEARGKGKTVAEWLAEMLEGMRRKQARPMGRPRVTSADVVRSMLAEPRATVETVAKKLGVSRRTVERRIDEGT